MTNIVEFLRARLDEDAQIASIISPGGYAPQEWVIEPNRSGTWSMVYARTRTNIEAPEDAVIEREAPVAMVPIARLEDQHIARHDPARVLCEVEAKRRIVGLVVTDPDGEPAYYDGYAEAWRDALRQLALPYADHADYDEAWRP